MYKLIAIDFDGTLLNSYGIISEEDKVVLKKAMENGAKIILTSGRSRKEAIEYQEQIGASPYIISSNGASCFDKVNKKEIYNCILKKEDVRQLLEYSETASSFLQDVLFLEIPRLYRKMMLPRRTVPNPA